MKTFLNLILIILSLFFQDIFAKITIDAPDTIYIHTAYNLNSFFEDTTGNSKYTEYWNWQLYVFDGSLVQSIIQIDSLYGYNGSTWNMSLDSIPKMFTEKSYINYSNLHILINGVYRKVYIGYLICFTIDNNNNSTHTIIKEVKIVGEETTQPINSDDYMFLDTRYARHIYENSKFTFKGIYIIEDGSPPSNYTEFWNWRLFIFHTNGIYTLAEDDSLPNTQIAEGFYACDWEVNIDKLPSYTWIKDSTDSILAFLTFNTTNRVGFYFSIIEELIFDLNPTSINDFNNHPKDFTLFQNYPNPFNPITTIAFTLLNNSYVELEIYNSIGQHVNTLVKKRLAAGNYSYKWKGEDKRGQKMPSGIYIIQLKTEYVAQTRKMVLIR